MKPIEYTAADQINPFQPAKGVSIRRVVGGRFSPFHQVGRLILLDDATINSGEGGFSPHSHRDIEIITYSLQGTGAHESITGDPVETGPGDVQRISAGTGITHGGEAASDPDQPGTEESGVSRGLQAWFSPDTAGVKPKQQNFKGDDLPVVKDGDGRRKVLVGKDSPIDIHVDARVYDQTLPAGGTTRLTVKTGRAALFYPLSGQGNIADQHFSAGDVFAFSAPNQPEQVTVTAETDLRWVYYESPVEGGVAGG